MTPTTRKREFKRLYNALPGKNPDRIRFVCETLFCKPQTVRIWCMKGTHRCIPEAKLRILERAINAST